MKQKQSRFIAILSSIGAPILGSCGGACGVACFAGGCCGGTALFGLIGLSGSTLTFMERLTPVFLAMTVLSLGFGFYNAYKPKAVDCCTPAAEGSSAPCCVTEKRTPFLQSKSFLWIVAVFCVVMWGYPLLTGSSQAGPGAAPPAGGRSQQNDSLNAAHGRTADAQPAPCCPSESGCETDCKE